MFANKLCLPCAIAATACIAATASAATLDVKTGAWESTITSTMTGVTIPADRLAKLPPEQRAKVEAMMKSQSGQSHTTTQKSCITQKDLDENKFLQQVPEAGCKARVLSQSSTRIEFERVCGTPPQVRNEHMVITATSPETVTMVGDFQQAGGKVHFEDKGRWLGSSCAGID